MTSIEWLIDQLEQKGDIRETPSIRNLQLNIDTSDYLELKRQAKEMHKQEIIDAQSYAISNADMTNNKGYFDCDKYYQETFVSKGSDKHKEKLKELYPDAFSILGEVLFREKSGFVDIVPKQETLYTEEQVRKAYFKGAADVHDKCTDRTWRGVETKVDIELLKKLNAEYIQSLKQPKKD